MEFLVADAVEVLGATPGVLRAMLGGLSAPWVSNNYGPETFSPFDVVGHLIHGERTDWVPRARIILEHGCARTFEPFDRYAMYEASQGKKIGELLDTFERLRVENLEVLARWQIDEAKLALEGMHPELGRVTLRSLLATWTVHDLNHIHQIAKCMGYQYGNLMGPWRAYITFLPK